VKSTISAEMDGSDAGGIFILEIHLAPALSRRSMKIGEVGFKSCFFILLLALVDIMVTAGSINLHV
jgi:hypothetical protein